MEAGAAEVPEEFERSRSRLFGLAYRMLGSAEEAEDVVQDTFLRWHRTEAGAIASAPAWLAKVAVNLCLNRLTSARVMRQSHLGPWLPEPVPTAGGALGPLDTAEQRDSVSMAFLVLSEQLNPVERAVFVLRVAFAYSHREISETLELSESNSRQLYGRARRRLDGAGSSSATRRPSDLAPHRELVARFLSAAQNGDLHALEELLAADAAVWVDGGGRPGVARRPISGASQVARYLVRARESAGFPIRLMPTEMNGAPAALALAGTDLIGVLVVETRNGRISCLRIVADPAKMAFAARLSHPGVLSGS